VRALLIPPELDQPIHDVQLPDVDTLRTMQQHVGGHIKAINLDGLDHVTCYVDEEGKFTQPRNPRATVFLAPQLFADDYIAGPLLVCGLDPATGATVPLTSSFDAAFVRFVLDMMPQIMRGRRPPTLAEHAAANPYTITAAHTDGGEELTVPEDWRSE
jgi:hypothetical protein